MRLRSLNGDWTTVAILAVVLGMVGVSTAQAEDAAAKPRPNIVMAIADDWGWPHASAYGDPVVKTPTFDRLAKDGVLFHQAYISSPSCTPSRGALITGQQFWRLDAGANLWAVWPQDKFAEYPALLEQAGYHVGKYRKTWGPGQGNPGGKAYPSVEAYFKARPEGQPFCFWFGASDPHRPYKAGTGKQSGMDLSKIELFPHFPDVEEVRSDVADYYFEVQRFDRELGELVERLEKSGELKNTIIAVTGDHNMPFPRCKGNIYDCGARVPLVIYWGEQVPGGRELTDFVSLTDLAPTFLDAAGLKVPAEMTGRSLLPALRSKQAGRVEAARDHVLMGRERHVPGQESPSNGGYPMRGLRTDDFLYIRNFEPDRWPAGTPHYEKAHVKNAWLADCDNGPTKTYLWTHRNEPEVKPLYELCFGKRPAEELYDLKQDPHQMQNVAADPTYAQAKERLSQQLLKELGEQQDPRVIGGSEKFDAFPYLGGAPTWNGK